ncbi:MAG: DUF539 domain-containing protein [Bradymonadia bacterium]
MTTVFVTIGFMASMMLIMAVGVIFRRPPLKGSCGGIMNGDCVCLDEGIDQKRAELAGAGLQELQADGVIVYGAKAS